MKISRRNLNRIIEASLFDKNKNYIVENKLTDKVEKIAGKIKELPIGKKLAGFFKKDKSKYPQNIEDDPNLELYMDRFDDFTKDLARKNYEKMRKDGTLKKTGLRDDGRGLSEPESVLMSYLLQGHRDFKGLSREEIESLLSDKYLMTSVHREESEVNTFNQEFEKIVGKVMTRKHKEIDSIISKETNLVTGEIVMNDMETVDFNINGQKLLMNFHVAKIKNMASYDYGFVPKKGEGKSVLASSIVLEIGDQTFEVVHNKGFGNSAIGDKKKAMLNKADGLHIDGVKAYGYNLDGSPKFSTPGAYQQAVGKIKNTLSKLKFPNEEKNTVISAFDESLKKIGFDPSVFKTKSRGREEVLIGADGKSIVGSANIDAHLKNKGIKLPDFGLEPKNIKERSEQRLRMLVRESIIKNILSW